MSLSSFRRRAWAVAFTGLPFAVFKGLYGFTLMEMGMEMGASAADGEPSWLHLAGRVVLWWAVADAVLNLLALVFPQRVSYCVLSMIGRGIGARAENLGLAVDTLLSFLVVSIMIGAGYIAGLPTSLGWAWNLAVIANVMAVGVERVWLALRTESS